MLHVAYWLFFETVLLNKSSLKEGHLMLIESTENKTTRKYYRLDFLTSNNLAILVLPKGTEPFEMIRTMTIVMIMTAAIAMFITRRAPFIFSFISFKNYKNSPKKV